MPPSTTETENVFVEDQQGYFMAGGGTASDSITTTKKVVVVGSGPAGLLTAIHILHRNVRNKKNGRRTRYSVTLVDRHPDYLTMGEGERIDNDSNDTMSAGKIVEEKKEHDDERHRYENMIGLSGYAMDAFSTYPHLFDGYIASIPIENKCNLTVAEGYGKLLMLGLTDEERARSGYLVDRNRVSKALAEYLNDRFLGVYGKDGEFLLTTLFNTEAVFVNEDYNYVMVRNLNPSTFDENTFGYTTLQYDLLIGCDGVHSVVRKMFEQFHNPMLSSSYSMKKFYSYDQSHRAGISKTISVSAPRNAERAFLTFARPIPNMSAFVFPDEFGSDQLNITLAFERTRPCDDVLTKVNDPAIVAAYFKRHFTPFQLNWDEVGRAWVQQRWFTSGTYCCTRYHSKKLSAILVGDEASVTMTNNDTEGGGIFRALLDVEILTHIMDHYDDKLEAVLPAYTKARKRQLSALKNWFTSL